MTSNLTFGKRKVVSGFLAILSIAAIWDSSSETRAEPVLSPPGKKFQIGVYDPYGTFSYDASIGIEHIYIPWQDANLESLKTADDYAKLRNRDLFITVEPWTWSNSSKSVDSADLLAGINSGHYDAIIKDICVTAASLKSSVTLRWGHEMDLANRRYPWSGWTPAEYVNAYRHFADVCRASFPAARFMWSPRGESSAHAYYPGDTYVDSIGLSIFGLQSYETVTYGKSLTLAERYAQPYKLVQKFDKDIYIAEFGCFGDEKYRKACMADVKSAPQTLPRIAGIVYFNEVETYPWPHPYGYPDWRVKPDPVATANK